MRYFLLNYRGEYHLEDHWWLSMKGNVAPSWACPECHGPLPGKPVQPVRLSSTPADRQSLPLVFGLYALFVGRAFLDVVCDGKTEQLFDCAAVLAPDGKPYQDWVVAVGKHKAVVRGTDLPVHSYCPACGTLRYTSYNACFLYPAPAEDADAFDAGPYQIVVPYRVLPRVLAHHWPRLNLQELTTPDEPPDGLGPLPLRHPPNGPGANA